MHIYIPQIETFSSVTSDCRSSIRGMELSWKVENSVWEGKKIKEMKERGREREREKGKEKGKCKGGRGKTLGFDGKCKAE